MEDSNQSYEDYFQPNYTVEIQEFQELRFSDSSQSLFQKVSKSWQDSKKQLTTRLFKKNLYPQESILRVIDDSGKIQEEYDSIPTVQFSKESIQKTFITRRGNSKETTWLNANLKTQTVNQLMRGIKLQIYNEAQKEAIWKFISSGCSFQDTLSLFISSEKIRVNCLQLFKSPELVQQIMCSSSMHFSNKIVFIKYLRQIEHNAEFPKNFRKWKEEHGAQRRNDKLGKLLQDGKFSS